MNEVGPLVAKGSHGHVHQAGDAIAGFGEVGHTLINLSFGDQEEGRP